MTMSSIPLTKEAFSSFLTELPMQDEDAVSAAWSRQKKLTKPEGSLGRLEKIACWFAGWRGTDCPRIEKPLCVVFAGNHGVVSHGVSAYPPEVTAQMVENFKAGGAAVNQLCEVAGVPLSVVPIDDLRATANMTEAAAMTESECLSAIQAGFEAVSGCDMLLVGEMGIGNSTSAAALAAATFGGSATAWAGQGTGVDEPGLARKVTVIYEALSRHQNGADSSFELMRRLGGKELAALMGAVLAARRKRIPVLLDGFIATAAAAVLVYDNPNALDHCLVSHMSAEPGHARLLKALGQKPILKLGMRLGEASGAATAFPVVRAAIASHSGMATFGEAAVSEKGGKP